MVQTRLWPLGLLFLLVGSSSAYAGKSKVQHKAVHPLPDRTQHADDLSALGTLTDVERAGEGWVVAGTAGIASLSDTLEVAWHLPLPEAQHRLLAVDAEGIAWTAYSHAGSVPLEGLKGLMGSTVKERQIYSGATIGLLSLEGQARWQSPLESEHAISKPLLTADAVFAVSHDAVVVASRESGALRRASVGARLQEDVEMAARMMGGPLMKRLLGTDEDTLTLLMEASLSAVRPMAPVSAQGTTWASVSNINLQVSPSGEVLWTSPLLKGRSFQNTAAPVVLDELVVFGSTTPQVGSKDRVVALEGRLGRAPAVAWSTAVINQVKTSDTGASSTWRLFGITDLDTLDAEHFVVAGEACVRMLNRRGKIEWEAWNKKGGLYRSDARAIVHDPLGASRASHGQLVLAHGDAVYASSIFADSDVITVLDAEKGQYRESWNLNGRAVDMAESSDAIAILTPQTLHVVPHGAGAGG